MKIAPKHIAIAAAAFLAIPVFVPSLRPLFEAPEGPCETQFAGGAEWEACPGSPAFNLLFIAGAGILAGRWAFARWERNRAIAAEVRKTMAVRAGREEQA